MARERHFLHADTIVDHSLRLWVPWGLGWHVVWTVVDGVALSQT
ncbi:MAG: hypothetical protein ABF436_10955 [Acetobacter okinawensis]